MSRRKPLLVLALALLSAALPIGSILSQGGPIVTSDDFSTGQLNTNLWTFVNPQGDGSYRLIGAGSSDAWLNLTVGLLQSDGMVSGGNYQISVIDPNHTLYYASVGLSI